MTNVTRFIHSLRGLHQLKTSGGAWEHILPDTLGSLRVVTDNSVGVLESRNYAVYGDLFGTTGTSQTSYGYTGEPTDGNGLVYDRARYMSPALGQFISLDPMETFNRYAYVDGNPVMRTDPSGLLFGAGSNVGGAVKKKTTPTPTWGGNATPNPTPPPPKPTQTTQNLVIPGFGSGSGATVSVKPAQNTQNSTVANIPVVTTPSISNAVTNNFIDWYMLELNDECKYLRNNPAAYADCRQHTTNNACPPAWNHTRDAIQGCYPTTQYDYGNGNHIGKSYPYDTAWQQYWGHITPEEGAQIAYDNRATCLENSLCFAAMLFGPLALVTSPFWGPPVANLAFGNLGTSIVGKMLAGARAGVIGHIAGTMVYDALSGKTDLLDTVTPRTILINGLAGGVIGGLGLPVTSVVDNAAIWNVFVAAEVYTFVHFGTSDHPLGNPQQAVAFFVTALANILGANVGIGGASFINSVVSGLQASAEEAK